jgi:cell division protein FtsB
VKLLKQNTKFIGIYVAILFSFALILILFAGLTQNNYQKEIEQHQSESAGVRKSLSALTKENEKMNDTIRDLQTEAETLRNDNKNLLAEREAALVAFGGDVATTRTLFSAYTEKIAGHEDSAREKIKSLNVRTMTEAQRYLYKTIIGE